MDSNASVAPFTAASAAGASGEEANRESPDKSNDPFNSSTMREAVFFPTPGIFEMSAVS